MSRSHLSAFSNVYGTPELVSWGRFVQLYTSLLYLWSNKQNLQAQDAADLMQDVLTTLVQKLPEFRYDPQKSFRAWVSTLMLNHLRNRRQARSSSAR